MKKKKIKVFLILFLIVAIITVFSYYARKNLIKFVSTYAHNKVQSDITRKVDIFASDGIDSYSKRYNGNYLNVEYDTEGKISFINVDMYNINMLQNEVAMFLYNAINEYCSQNTINVPMGVFLGSVLFSDEGSLMDVDIVPIATVITAHKSKFESTGINQTLFSLYFDIQIQVAIVLPFYTEDVLIESSCVVYECLVPGEVPSVYFTI